MKPSEATRGFSSPEAEARFMSDPHRVVYEARQRYFDLATKQRSTY